MSSRDPQLRRPVWLTTEQRHQVRDATIQAMQNPKADLSTCETVLRELVEATRRDAGTTRLVQLFAHGLKMPEGTVPVYLCDLQVTQLIRYGSIASPIKQLLEDKAVKARKPR